MSENLTHYEEKFGFLSWLALLLESWKPLTIVPTFIAISAYGFTFFMPEVYQSTAYLRIDPAGEKVLISEEVLASTVRQFPELIAGSDNDSSGTKNFASSIVKSNAGKNILKVTLYAHTAPAAQARLKGLIQSYHSAISKRHLQLLASTEDFIRLQDEMIASLNSKDWLSLKSEELRNVFDSLLSLGSEKLVRERELMEYDLDYIYLSEPTLENEKVKPERLKIATLLGGTVGALLIFFVVVKDAVSRATTDPDTAESVRRIRAVFRK